MLTFGGHRYLFVNEQLAWEAAKVRAEAMRGHLATLTTQEERQWAHDQLLHQRGLRTSHVMIGGFQARRGAPWVWVTGEPFDMSLWGTRGPDGSGPYLTMMLEGGRVVWDDVSANDRDCFLVEWDDLTTTIPAESLPATPLASASAHPAPSDALSFGGHRYKFFVDDEPWNKAKVKAEKMGGHLATLTTKEEDEWVRKTFVASLPPGRLLHIGGVRAKGSNQFTWVTGEPWSFQRQGFAPKPEVTNMFGLEYQSYGGGKWVAAWDAGYFIPIPEGPDKGQSRIRGYLVEWDTDEVESPVAAAGARAFGGHRYLLVHDDVSWRDANERAVAMGGHLATLTTKEENDWVRQNFVESLPKEQLFYIGGLKTVGEGESWQWITGEPWSFQNWDGGKLPDAAPEARGAAFMNLARSGPHWAAKWDAGKKLGRSVGFLVEWDSDQVDTKPAPVASTPPLDAEPVPIAPVDLMAGVDVKRDVTFGRWEMKPEGVTGNGMLLFNLAAPEEYDFETEFTATSGTREAELIVPLPTHAIIWRMGHGPETEDPTFFGFGPSFDPTGLDSTQRGRPTAILPRLKLGRRYRCVLEVRKRSVRAVLDGKEIVSWSGDLERLSIRGWSDPIVSKINNQRHPGMYVVNSGVLFHKAALSPKGAIVDKLAELEAQFKDAYERDVTRGAAGKALANLDDKYLAALDHQIAEATKSGKTDDLTALRQEKQRIANREPLPAADPVNIVVSLGKIRDIYRRELGPLLRNRDVAAETVYDRYEKGLAAFQADLAGKGEALAVQDLRDTLERKRHPAAIEPVIAAVAPAPAPAPAPNGKLAMAPSKPAEPKPKNDNKPKKEAAPATLPPEALQEPIPKAFTSTQAIEWALSLGGSAKIKRGSVESEIVTLGKIPKSNIVLTSLKIGSGQPLHVVSLAALSQLADLRELILDDNIITNAGLSFLPKLPKLTRLSLRGCGITDVGLAQLAKQSTLTSLDLSANPINGSGLRELAGLQGITTMGLGGTQLSDENISALTAFVALSTLNLGDKKPLIATNLSALATLKSLRHLSLGQAATDAAVRSLESLQQLTVLDLNRSPISDAALERFGSMRGLRDLNFYECRNLTDFGFARLQALKGLTRLNVEHTRLTDSQFIELSTKLLEITDINVASDAMTDQGLAGLVNLRKLSSLGIHARMCTDVGLGYVKRVAGLRNFGIIQRETLSPARFEALKRALPNFPW
jgi:hypothetical protein